MSNLTKAFEEVFRGLGSNSTTAPQPAQQNQLPRILGVFDIGKTSLQLVFETRAKAEQYKQHLEEGPQ